MTTDPTIRDAALAWAMATRAPDFADWDGFAAWLEADPAHAATYDAVQYALEEADAVLAALPEPAPASEPEPVAANDNPPGWFAGRRAWLGGAIAASLVAALTSVLWMAPGSEKLYRTAPGETRLIALGDGSTVELAGGSALALEGPRAARLEAGQALFTIRHDAADPFVLVAGGERLVDAGTVFDVRLAGETLDVAVAEGAVIVDPQGQAIRLDPGERAVRRDGRFRLADVDGAAVGEWRRGRISFEAASLAEIAAELTRATGTRFTSTDTATRLSGSIAVDAVRADPQALGPLLAVQVTRAGDSWAIAAR
ncbi:FecR domain-containing protein [Erythrobacter sp. CCH5-A1]|jgi:transmembrane sensor|uniref:FecR family protein n=1 Tax=Erythrobacter sp. CCH5-A1 TaxID=1768792 RepID=UPI0008344DEC|nr:FecR domain-containing protein [Erythrobacter sp. CCH5-A1]